MKILISTLLTSLLAISAWAEGSWSGGTYETGMQVTRAQDTGEIRQITDFCYNPTTDTLHGTKPIYKNQYVTGGGMIITERQAMYRDNVRVKKIVVGQEQIMFNRSFYTYTRVCPGSKGANKSESWKEANCPLVRSDVKAKYRLSGTIKVMQRYKDNSDMERELGSRPWAVETCN